MASFLDNEAIPGVPWRLLLKMGLYINARAGQILRDFGLLGDLSRDFAEQALEILWELYWRQPSELEEMIHNLVIPVPEEQQYPHRYNDPIFSEKKIQDVIAILYPEGATQACGLASDPRLLRKLADGIEYLPGIDSSEAAETIIIVRILFNENPRDPRLVQPGVELLRQKIYRSPSWEAVIRKLYTIIQEQVIPAAGSDIKNIIQSLWGKPKHPVSLNTSILANKFRSKKNMEDVNCVVLFAPSGAGKTYETLQYLGGEFGFYFQACRLPLITDGSGVHGQRRQSGPKDTYSLGKMIEYAKEQGNAVFPGTGLRRWFVTLVDSRFFVFSNFLDEAHELLREARVPPQDIAGELKLLWRYLQMHDEPDVFNPLFCVCSILTLFDPVFVESQLKCLDTQARISKHGFSRSLSCCLDEAQADLGFVFEQSVPDSSEPFSLLNIWAETFMDFSITRKIPTTEVPVSTVTIFSGTSLKLKEAADTIRGARAFRNPMRWVVDELYALPQITSDGGFNALFNSSPIAVTLGQEYAESATVIRLKVIKCAKKLFGRPRWSRMYLDSLEQNFNGCKVDEWAPLIDRIAKNTCDVIVQDLYVRLDTLSARQPWEKYYELMDDLCRITIYQELLDSGYFFMEDERHVFVSEGFAYMKPIAGTNVQVINEALAIQAATRFFLQKKPKMVKKTMHRIIENQQNDPGAVGKTAEWFLAWNLHRAFKSNDDRSIGSPDEGRAATILSALSSAKAFPFGDSTLDLSGYTVIQGQRIGYMYDSHRAVELSTWMESILESQNPISTFYFPDEQAGGPDVVFALQPPQNNPTTPVLCLLQLKITQSFDQGEAIETTDLNKAYQNKPGVYQERKEILDATVSRWSQKGYRILRVLFTAQTLVLAQPIPTSGTGCLEYFIRIGQQKTQTFFGREFDFLLNYWRTKQDFQRSSLDVYKELKEQCF